MRRRIQSRERRNRAANSSNPFSRANRYLVACITCAETQYGIVAFYALLPTLAGQSRSRLLLCFPFCSVVIDKALQDISLRPDAERSQHCLTISFVDKSMPHARRCSSVQGKWNFSLTLDSFSDLTSHARIQHALARQFGVSWVLARLKAEFWSRSVSV